MTHWPSTVEVTESLEAASQTVSETMGTSTSSRTLELAAGQDAVLPHPGKQGIRRGSQTQSETIFHF